MTASANPWDRPAPFAYYVPESDILFVQLTDRAIARTTGPDDWVNIDYAADGSVVAVEFVNATASFRLHDIPEADQIARIIAEAGIVLPAAVEG